MGMSSGRKKDHLDYLSVNQEFDHVFYELWYLIAISIDTLKRSCVLNKKDFENV